MSKANELTDATIPFISFVKKGANGDPLRILKADASGEGLDLAAAASQVLASVNKSGEGAAPAQAEDSQIIFFSANTEEAAGALEEVLTVLGLKTENPMDTEHGLVFMQADKVPADIVMVELEPGVHMALASSTKKADLYGCSGEEATSFETVMGTEGAVPMAGVVLEALSTTVRASLRSAKTAEEARTNIGAALRGAASYFDRIVGAIPMTAFKVEMEMAEADAVELTDEPAAEGEKPKDETTEQKGEGEKPAAEGAAPADDTKPTPEAGKDKPAAEDTAQKSAGAVDTDAIITAVTKAVEAKLQPIQEAVAQVTERVQKSEQKLSGTLTGGRGHGEEPSRTKKGEQPDNGSDDFNFDTGMNRRI